MFDVIIGLAALAAAAQVIACVAGDVIRSRSVIDALAAAIVIAGAVAIAAPAIAMVYFALR